MEGIVLAAMAVTLVVEVLALVRDPWQRDRKAKDRRKRQPLASGKPEEWTWNARRPEIWEPKFAENGDTVTITFHTFSGLGQEAIYRLTDTYERGRYMFKTREDVIADGPSGYVF